MPSKHDRNSCLICLYGENINFGFLVAIVLGIFFMIFLRSLEWFGMASLANSLEHPLTIFMVIAGAFGAILYEPKKDEFVDEEEG